MSETLIDPNSLSSQITIFVGSCRQYITTVDSISKNGPSISQNKQQYKLLLNSVVALYTSASTLDLEWFKAFEDSFIDREYIVTEELYNSIHSGLKPFLGEHNIYLDFEVRDMQFSERGIALDISELIADIHQETTNFVWNYSSANDNEMVKNTLLYEILSNFLLEWGEKALVVIRVLHRIYAQMLLLNDSTCF